MKSGASLTTLSDISAQIDQKKISPLDLVENCLERIAKMNPALNLFITITGERARKSAEQSSERAKRSRRLSQLDGIPLAVKDNFFIRGIRCTAGSKIMSDYIPDFTAPAVERIEQGGAAIVGKTNLHEFASGPTTENPHYGNARNPWNPDYITGGSSGGSAAAVAGGLAIAALGTDTGGSVRIPASFCGVVGLKPTYGLISCRGSIPLSVSEDHVGILSRTCTDAAVVLDAAAGYDKRDPASVRAPRTFDYFEETLRTSKVLHRVGVPREFFLELLDEDVRRAFERAQENIRSLGFEVKELDIPGIAKTPAVWGAIRFSEATAYHNTWFQTRPNDYGKDVRERLERGKKYGAVEYILAKEEAAKFRAQLIKEFEYVDAFITPTTPIPAPKIGQSTITLNSLEMDVYSVLTKLTPPFNVAGVPAVSIPVGLSRIGLPIGLQIIGRPFDEATILGIGSTYEENFREIGLSPIAL